MGSISFDFLANSFLMKSDSLDSGYSKYTDKEIKGELLRYKEFILKNYDKLIAEIVQNRSQLKIFSGRNQIDINSLKQLSLYVDQQIINDPVFSITVEQNNSTKVMSEYLGFDKFEIDRTKLIRIIKTLKELTPMVATDYVKMFPLNLFFERNDEIPIYHHPNYAADILPEKILEFYHENMHVKSLTKVEKGWAIENDLKLSRAIIIGFRNHGFRDELIYNLFETKFDATEDERKFISRSHLPDSLPDLELFNAWVYQSMNKTAKAHFDKMYFENMIAAQLNANYLTTSEFDSLLLNENYPTTDNISTFTVNELLSMELSFLDKIKIDDLMKVRSEDGEVFKTFRLSLEKQFRELRRISDINELKLKKENIIHEMYDVQVNEMNKKIKSLKRKTFVDAVMLTGGFTGTVLTKGWSLVASAISLVQGYRNYSEYIEKVKEHPSYFLWKVSKNKDLK